jgi:hypothetical protein
LHLATLFGLLFMIVTPAALVGDEPNHFFRLIKSRKEKLSAKGAAI